MGHEFFGVFFEMALRLWNHRDELDPLEVLFLRLVEYTHDLALEYRAENNVTGIECSASGSHGQKMLQQLDNLPEQERLMYLLHVADGYTIRELSRAFGISEDEVREVVGGALVALDKELVADLAEQATSSQLGGSWS